MILRLASRAEYIILEISGSIQLSYVNKTLRFDSLDDGPPDKRGSTGCKYAWELSFRPKHVFTLWETPEIQCRHFWQPGTRMRAL